MKRLLTVLVLVSMGFAVNAQTTVKTTHKKTATTKKHEKTPEVKKDEGTTKTTTTTENNTMPKSAVKFDQQVYDFGEVEYSSDVSHTFTFKNLTKNPIAVKDVGTSCGCTTPGFSKEPVMPGKSGTVTAKYDSSRIGGFTKTLTVYLTNDETIVLTIKGTIKPPKSEGQ